MAYTEDLMAEQVRRGHEVTYVFGGRQYPLVSGPRLRRREREGVAMLEVVNSPLHDHGRQPDLELNEPRTERLLAGVIEKVRPDVVHVHELAGLPSSVLDLPRRAGIPCVFTLQDYFPLCPVFKLVDHGGQVCLRREVGADCVATVASQPLPAGLLTDATIRHEMLRLLRLDPRQRHSGVDWLARTLGRRVPDTAPASAAAYQRRRDVNVERLSRTDRLIAMSTRVAAIYTELGVDPGRIQTVQLTLAHIERLKPRSIDGELPVTFGALNALASEAKGARLLIDAVRIVAAQVPAGSFRLLAPGDVAGHLRPETERLAAIETPGVYWPNQVDSFLGEIDVGMLPSVWEEAYGYVGMEFLAKGIPVIANAIGGMTDYTRDGETGWLNHSLSAEELARIMIGIVERPQQIAELNARIRANRDSIVKTMAEHADEMDALYTELAAARAAA